MLEKTEVKRILQISISAGKIMLEYGAETYRVEDTMNRICKSRGIERVNNFVVPTSIFIACEYGQEAFSYIERARCTSINLNIIAMVNAFSREFVNSAMSLEDAEQKLYAIKNTQGYSPMISSLFGGAAGGFITLMFSGGIAEFVLSFIISALTVFTARQLTKRLLSYFTKNLIGGFLSVLMAVLLTDLYRLFVGVNLSIDKIIIGSLMPLMPGLAMINALRDSITGDYVSGMSKLSEAVLSAIAIAIGAGAGLSLQLVLYRGAP